MPSATLRETFSVTQDAYCLGIIVLILSCLKLKFSISHVDQLENFEKVMKSVFYG